MGTAWIPLLSWSTTAITPAPKNIMKTRTPFKNKFKNILNTSKTLLTQASILGIKTQPNVFLLRVCRCGHICNEKQGEREAKSLCDSIRHSLTHTSGWEGGFPCLKWQNLTWRGGGGEVGIWKQNSLRPRSSVETCFHRVLLLWPDPEILGKFKRNLMFWSGCPWNQAQKLPSSWGPASRSLENLNSFQGSKKGNSSGCFC